MTAEEYLMEAVKYVRDHTSPFGLSEEESRGFILDAKESRPRTWEELGDFVSAVDLKISNKGLKGTE